MKYTKPSEPASPFLSLGLSTAVPLWLLFHQSLQSDHWKSEAQSLLAKHQTSSDTELIQYWLYQQDHYHSIHTHSSWTMFALGGLFGFLTMLGGLNYSGNEPINLWLMLGLYCFIPLLMSAVTAYTWFRHNQLGSGTKSTLVPSRYAWANRLFAPLLKILTNKQNLNQKNLLQCWLIWRLQGAALAFQFTAILTFILVLTFKDLAFGWSSTIIQSDTWIPALIENLARPWSWLIPPPSTTLIEASRFYRGETTFDAAILGQWWSYIFMAMILYGLLPRLLLASWMKRQTKTRLADEIQASGDIALFIRASRQINTKAKASSFDEQNQEMPKRLEQIDHSHYHFVAWQYQAKNIETEVTLGENDWDSDTEWLHIHAGDWHKTLGIVVALEQTPTAELADILLLIRERKAKQKISVILCSPNTLENTRELGLLKSWQHFASSNHLSLNIFNTDTSTPSAPHLAQ